MMRMVPSLWLAAGDAAADVEADAAAVSLADGDAAALDAGALDAGAALDGAVVGAALEGAAVGAALAGAAVGATLAGAGVAAVPQAVTTRDAVTTAARNLTAAVRLTVFPPQRPRAPRPFRGLTPAGSRIRPGAGRIAAMM
jgi:hypothetical protein